MMIINKLFHTDMNNMFASPEFDNVPASAGSQRALSLGERVVIL